MLFVGWEVRIVKNCDLGLETAALSLRPWAVFSRPLSQFFTTRTSQPALGNWGRVDKERGRARETTKKTSLALVLPRFFSHSLSFFRLSSTTESLKLATSY